MKRLIPSLIVLSILFTNQAQAFILQLQMAGTNKTTFDAYTGQPLELEIFVDTEGEPLAGVSVYLSFDETCFEVVDADPRNGLQPVKAGPFITWQTLENDTHGDPGNSIQGFQVDYSKMTLSAEGAVIGSGVVGIVTLIPVKPIISTKIGFDDTRFFNRETQGSRVDDGIFTPIRFRLLNAATISIKGGPQFDRPVPEARMLLGESQQYDLDDYVSDSNNPDAALDWTFGELPSMEISFDSGTHLLIVRSDGVWTGQDILAMEVSDPEGNTASGELTVIVEAAPVLKEFADLTLRLSGIVERLRLDEYVEDTDTPPELIQWNVAGNTHVSAKINGQRILTLEPLDEWHGTETLVITATDPEGHSDQTEMQVRVLPDKTNPVVSILPDVFSSADGSYSQPAILDLDEYVMDPDDTPETLVWSAESEGQILVEIDPQTHEVTFRSDGWTGAETVLFTVTDPQGETGKGSLMATLVPVTMPPILKPFPDVQLIAHAPGKVIDLDEYVFDLNHTPEQIEWSAQGQKVVVLTFGPRNLVTISSEQPAQETITLTVTDPDGNQAEGQLLVTAEGLQPPVIAALPETVLKAGEAKTAYDLDDFTSDDFTLPEQIEWRATGVNKAHLMVSIGGDHNVLVVANNEWSGTEAVTFIASDTDGNETSREATFRVTTAPELSLPARYEVLAGTTDTSFVLDAYVTDSDTPTEKLRWAVESDSDLVVGLQGNQRGLMLYAPQDLLGEFSVSIQVSDPEENRATAPLLVAVVDEISATPPPELTQIPDLQLEQGQGYPLVLRPFTSDEDTPFEQLTWEVASDQDQVTVSMDGDVLQITAAPDYLGEARITVAVQDPEEHVAEVSFMVTVVELGSLDPTPVLMPFPEISVMAGAMDASVDLDDFVHDVDTDKNDLQWEILDLGILEAFVDADSHRLLLTAPKDAEGNHAIEIQVADPEGNIASQSLTVLIESNSTTIPTDPDPEDRASPTFEVFVLENPLLAGSFQIIVQSDESLKADPVVTVSFDERETGIDVQGSGVDRWRGIYLAPIGQTGTATVKILGVDMAGNIGEDDSKQFAVASASQPPKSVQLSSYPNPAITNVTFLCQSDGQVTPEVRIYNVHGTPVATLSPEQFRPTEGGHALEWDLTNDTGQRICPGLYFARLNATYRNARTYHDTRKIFVLPQE